METFFYKQLDSTNLQARRLLADNQDQDSFWVVCAEQRNGKGYGSNHWESEAHKNFTGSLVFFPESLSAARQFLISKLVSLGLVDFLELYLEEVRVKWPNDIYQGSRKIAGILIENDIMGDCISQSIIGIGLNMNQTDFRSDAPNPISLKSITGLDMDLNEAGTLLRSAVERRLKQIPQVPEIEIHQEYLRVLYQYKTFAPYKYKDGWLEARIVGIDEFGELQLEDKSGIIRSFGFKEVEFILP